MISLLISFLSYPPHPVSWYCIFHRALGITTCNLLLMWFCFTSLSSCQLIFYLCGSNCATLYSYSLAVLRILEDLASVHISSSLSALLQSKAKGVLSPWQHAAHMSPGTPSLKTPLSDLTQIDYYFLPRRAASCVQSSDSHNDWCVHFCLLFF